MASVTAVATRDEKTFIGHPRGLFVLFFAEMWERFSYYGMRALLTLYLIGHFGFTDPDAYAIYGTYTALVYITPVIGGYAADKLLGQRKAVLYGAILLTFGHFLMGFEGDGGKDPFYLAAFYLAASFIIVGSGFLKANISSIVGSLYARDDVRRDPAFTIFYIGINLGAALGSIFCGWIGQTYSWSYGFGLAGIGMLLGLVVFVLGKPLLMGQGESPVPARLAERVAGMSREWWIYLAGLGGVAVTWFLMQHNTLVGNLLGVAGLIVVIYIVYEAVTKLERIERDRVFAALILILLSVLPWALFEQAGSSLNVYTDEQVNRVIFGIDVPASVFQSVNSICIMIFGPIFAWLWTFLGRRGLEPSTPAKFGLAIIQIGAGFLVLVAGATAAGPALTPVIFVFLIYLFHTTGELCFSPVGLSAMTKMATARMVSVIMGTWFLGTAGGNWLASQIAQATGGEDVPPTQVIHVYSEIGWFAVGAGVVVILISPFIKRLMHLDTLGSDHALAGENEIGESQAAGTHTERELR